MTTSRAILTEATRRIVERFDPVKVILFGSHARGTADERSDVDLLVLHPLRSEEERWRLALEMDRALAGFDPPLACDIVVLTPEEFERDRGRVGRLAYPADREGEVLYERAA